MRGALAVSGRELRLLLRTTSAAVAITAYLIAGLVVATVARARAARLDDVAGSSPLSPVEVANAGRSVFEWVVVALLVALLLAIPALLAGSIAGERERGTLDGLRRSPAGWRAVFAGKVFGAVVLVAMFTVAAVPAMVAAALLGGVTAGDVVRASLILGFSGVVIALLTLACSATVDRSGPALAVSYGVLLVLTFGTGALRVAGGEVPVDDPSVLAIGANPVVFAAAAIGEPEQLAAGAAIEMSPLRGVRESVAGTLPLPTTTTAPDPQGNLTVRGPMGLQTTNGELEIDEERVVVPLDPWRLSDRRRSSAMVLGGLALLSLPYTAWQVRSRRDRRRA